MDNTAPVITEPRPQPQQFADSQSHADQTSFYTRYFGNRVVNTLCTIASAAALYLMPVAGLVISTIVVIKLIYDRKVSVVPQDEVQPIVSRANDDVRAADSGPLETTSGSRCVIIPQTGATPSFTHEAEATLAAQTDGKPCDPLTSEEGLLSTQILKSPDLDSKPALATELEPHELKTGRQIPDTTIPETASQHSLAVDKAPPIKTVIESINNETTNRSTSPLPAIRTSSQPLAQSTPSTSFEGALATLSDTEPTGRELVPASSTSVSSLNGQSNDLKAFYFTVDVAFSGKNVQVGFKPVDGSQFQSQSGTIATLRMLPESQNALMPGQSNELLTGLTPLELAFKDENGMPSKAEPFVFWVSRDWIRKHINAGHNGAFLTFDRNEFNNHQLGQQLKPAIENGHQHPMTNGATVNGVAPLQRSLKAVDIETRALTTSELVSESNDTSPLVEHSTESSPKRLYTLQIVEDKSIEPSFQPVSMVKKLDNSSSEPTTDDESDDDTDSLYSGDNDGQKLTFDDSDIDAVLGESSEDNWSSSEEDTETQANNEVSSPSSAVAAINKEQTGQLSVAVITSDIQLPAHLKNRKDQKKPKTLEQTTPLTTPATKEKVDTTFEKLFCFFLGLSDKKKNPSWDNTNPYKNKKTKTKLKPEYLDRFFTIDQVFGQACDPVTLIRCLMEPFDTMDPNIRWGVMARAVELDDFGVLIKGNVEKGKLTPADIPAEKQRELLWTATMEAYLKFLERCQNEYSSTRKVKRAKALPKISNFDHIVLLTKLNCDIEKCSKQLQSFTMLTEEQLTEQKQSSLRELRTKVLELQARAKEAMTTLDAMGVDKKLVSNILNPCSDKAEDECSSKERESHTLHKLLKRIDKKLENFSSETRQEHQSSSASMIMSDAQSTKVSKAGLLSQEAPPPLDSHNLVEGVSEPTPDKQTRSSDESSSSSEEESDEPSDLPVSGAVSHTAATPTISPADSDFSSEAEIKTIYDHIIPFCLKLHRGKTTNWQGVHPYGEENSTTYMNPKYTKRMLNEVAFGAGAEFINFVNTVNTQIVNIQDERRIKGLLNLIEHPIVEGKLNLKGTEIRDKMLEVTKKHCLNFFEAAAKQYSEKNKAENKRKDTPHYTFDLLLPLQKLNYEFSLLVRDVNIINHGDLTIGKKMEMLLDLHVRAHELQSRQEQLYKRCLEKNIPLNKISFIFGGLDSDKKTTRIAEFQGRVLKTLQKTMDHAHKTLEPKHPFWAFVDNIENTTMDIFSLAARAFDKWDVHFDSLSVQGITHPGTFETIKSCESANILMEVPHEEVREQVKMDLKSKGYRLLLSSSDKKSTELGHQTFLDKRGEHTGSEQAAADAALDEITHGIDKTLLKTDALTENTRLKFKSMIMRNSHAGGVVLHTQLSKIVTDHICKSLPMENCVIQGDSASRTSSSHFTLKDNKKTLTMVREMEWDLRLYQEMEDGDLDQVTLPHQKRIRIETSHELDLTKDPATCSPEEIVSFTGLKISDVPEKAQFPLMDPV